jgi:hypothetical protein
MMNENESWPKKRASNQATRRIVNNPQGLDKDLTESLILAQDERWRRA